MSAVKSHPNITLWTWSEVTKVEGYVGNYKVTVMRRKPRYVDEDLCVGCLECMDACIYKQAKFPDDFNLGLGKRKPIYIPFPQAVPQVPVIDRETCIEFKSGKCKKTCIEACGDRHAINFGQQRRRSRSKSEPSFWPPVSRHSTRAGRPITAMANTPTSTPRSKWSAWSTPPAPPPAK